MRLQLPACSNKLLLFCCSALITVQYYADGSVAEMVAALAEMYYLKCKIIVGGRLQTEQEAAAAAAAAAASNSNNSSSSSSGASCGNASSSSSAVKPRFITLADVLQDSPLPASMQSMFLGLEVSVTTVS
jgi:hypothetical protein